MRYARYLIGQRAALVIVACWVSVTASLPTTNTTINLPAMNLPGGDVVVSDGVLAYTLPDPLTHAGMANAPFTHFHTRIFVVSLRSTGTSLVASAPRLLLAGPPGDTMTMWSIAGGWLVYSQYSSSDPAGPWVLVARHVATGRLVVLDTPAREGVPSLVAQAASDGRTVVWQSWTQVHRQATSVVRSYDLVTGQRQVLVEGGAPNSWFYAWPGVSGRWVVFEKEQPRVQPTRSQIMLADIATHQVRPLTDAAAANSEPSISGDIVTWKVGWRYENGQGVVIADLRTGMRHVLTAPNAEQPKVTAGRYVVFPLGNPGRVQLYDARTGTRRTLAGPQPDGSQPGNIVVAGGHLVVFMLSKLSSTTTPPSMRLVVTLLP